MARKRGFLMDAKAADPHGGRLVRKSRRETTDRITYGSTVRRLAVPGVVLTETLHAAGTDLPRHEHANPNVNFVLSGAFGERVQRREFSCGAGCALVKPGGAGHSNRYGASPAHCLVVEFNGEGGSWAAGAGLVDDVRYNEDTTIASIGWRLYREVLDPDDATPLVLQELLSAPLGRAGKALGWGQQLERQTVWLRRLRERLDCPAADPPELDQLALEAGVHPRHLMRMFRRYVGCSMGHYLRRARVRRAQRLLAETPMGLAAVALETGFYDQSHFTRTFKRMTGITPGAYRGLTTSV
jgi:AraC family transcriptional regulator